MSRRPLSLNLALINGPMDDENDVQDLGLMNSTFRHDGFSIGRDYVRVMGSTLSRGDFGDSLIMKQTLGKGACSRVVKAMRQDTPVALKQFVLSTDERKEMLSKELSTLHKMDCECLVTLLGAFFSENTVTLVLEYMDGGSLEACIADGTPLADRTAAAVCYQMLWGLSYLHFEGCLHRDVKPANVLLHSDGSVKLSDFGISSMLGDTMNKTVVGTTKYMALERLRAKQYGTPSDVWSLGLVMAQCITGVLLFADFESVVELVVTLEDELGENATTLLPPVDNPMALEVLQGCLYVQYEKRMPANIMLRSPWFEGISSVDDARDIVKEFLAGTPGSNSS